MKLFEPIVMEQQHVSAEVRQKTQKAYLETLKIRPGMFAYKVHRQTMQAEKIDIKNIKFDGTGTHEEKFEEIYFYTTAINSKNAVRNMLKILKNKHTGIELTKKEIDGIIAKANKRFRDSQAAQQQ